MNIVLVVDDEVSILNSMRRSFVDETDIEIVTANNAKEASVLLAQRAVDLIISDERMPQVTGTEFLRFAKERYPKVPRIILTGHASQEATIAAVNRAEVFRYLTKPWDGAELVATVRQGLELKQLRDRADALALELQSKNEALQRMNRDLEKTVAERTQQLRVALGASQKQNAVLKSQRASVVELVLALIGQYDRDKGRAARQIWESVRRYAEPLKLQLSEAFPFAALLHVFFHPGYMGGDDTYLRLLASVDGFSAVTALIMGTQENWDGSGPTGAKGENIPFESRLLRVAADFHALNPDNRALSRSYILSQKFKLYDPELAQAYLLTCVDDFADAPSFPVAVDKLLPGMVLCKDVHLVNGAVLLPAGTALSITMIAQLKKVVKLIGPTVEIYKDIQPE